MGDAIGSKSTCKTFSTEFFDWRIQSKKSNLSTGSSFSTGSASRNSQSEKVESKKPFFDCVRKPDVGFSRKKPFSTDKSDCIRNGLTHLFLLWHGVLRRPVFFFSHFGLRVQQGGPRYITMHVWIPAELRGGALSIQCCRDGSFFRGLCSASLRRSGAWKTHIVFVPFEK